MSVRQATDVRYCSTADVARYLRGVPSLVNGDDFPPEGSEDLSDGGIDVADVERFIEKWTAKFDRKTGQSFRPNQIHDETHDHDRLYYWLSGHPINVIKRNIITPLDSSKGDKLEIWTGNEWEDWVADPNREEGREEDYWVDNPVGIIFVYERAILRPHPKFRISYRYGGEEDSNTSGQAAYVPADVREAVAAGAASDILQSDIYGTTVPGNPDDGPSPQDMASDYREQFEDTYRDYKKIHWV
jgi:hypothetical protein